jgi:hypothetical protein
VRSDPHHFVVVPGHEIPDVETVIERNEGWWIIEKPGEVAHIVNGSGPKRD